MKLRLENGTHRGSRGMSARRGMSTHDYWRQRILSGLETVSHSNPNIDLPILPFPCICINKKLCLKMFFFYNIDIMCVVQLLSGIGYSKLYTAT